MAFTWCKIPNLWGLPLRLSTLWVAEIYGLFGVGLIIQGSNILSFVQQHYGVFFRYEWLLGILPTFIGALLVLTSIALIIGVYKNKPGLMLLWIIVVTTIHILLVIGLLTLFLVIGTNQHGIAMYGMTFLYAVIYIESQRFLVMGVYSYYMEIKVVQKGCVYSPENREVLQLPQVEGFHWALLASNNGGNFNPGYAPPSVQGQHWVLQPGKADFQLTDIRNGHIIKE